MIILYEVRGGVVVFFRGRKVSYAFLALLFNNVIFI